MEYRSKILAEIAAAENGERFNLWKNRAAAFNPNIGYNYFADSNSATESINNDLDSLRVKSQELYANHPVAKTLINNIASAVVGTGFGFSVDTDSDDLNDSLEDHICAHFLTESVDADKERNLNQILDASVRGMYINGASFATIVADKEEYTTAEDYNVLVRCFDITQIETPPDKRNAQNNHGVEFDLLGKPKALWVKTGNPKKPYSRKNWRDEEGNRIVLRLQNQTYERQQHELPPLAPVYNSCLDLSTFRKNELNAAVNASAINVVATTPNPKAAFDNMQSGQISKPKGAAGSPADNKPTPIYSITPGGMIFKGPNDELQQFELKRPIAGFDVFCNSILKDICGTLGFAVEFIYKAFSDSNYASARQAIIQSLAEVKRIQDIVIDKFIRPLLVKFIQELVATDKITLPDGMTEKQLLRAIKILRPKVPVLDLQREAAGYVTLLNANLISKEDASHALQLGDWYKTNKQIQREAEESKPVEPEPEAETEIAPQVGKPPGENSTRS